MAFQIVWCENCKKKGTTACAMSYQCSICGGQWTWNADSDFCSDGETAEEERKEYVYTAEEVDRDIKVNIRLINKFREQLYAEYGDTVQDISKMYETLYQEQMKEMPLLWYNYGIVSKK